MLKYWDEISRRVGFGILSSIDRARTSAAQLEVVQGWLEEFDSTNARYPDPKRRERDEVLRADFLAEIEWLKQGNMNFPDERAPAPETGCEFYTPTPRDEATG